MTDLVLTKEIVYKALGSTVKLVCPIDKAIRDISWFGPPNYSLYAVGTDVSAHSSALVEIIEADTDKKSILVIHRLTENLSGEFRCIYFVNESEFNLVIKRNPSDLVIVNATANKISTVQGREHNLECKVNSGQPGGNITWSTDGAVVAIDRPSSVSYKLIPRRLDNGKLFECEAFNNEDESILKSSVHLEVFYIPNISFHPKQTLTVNEGEDAQLICVNDGNDLNATTVWKIKRTQTITSKNNKLYFNKVNRIDAGLFTCRVATKTGVYKDNAKVVVQYNPTIDIRYSPTERKIKCIPSGVPDSYDFKDWEHTTGYNDHIRFLPITKEGNNAILTIPENVTGKDHLRDNGIYICRASNNISSTNGTFVMRKYNLSLTGTPYFVSSTENTQYGVYFKTAKIKIRFVSIPEYNSFDVYKNGSRFIDFTESVYRNIKLTDTIYGKNVSVKGTILSLQIQIDSLDDFGWYKVVVKNAIGCSNHNIRLVSANKCAIVETSLSAQRMVILSLVIIIALLVIGMGLYALSGRLKQRHRERMELAINTETPEGTNDEITHYTEITEIDFLQPTSQENDNSILPMNKRDTNEVSAEQTSTSSDNDRDSTEYLDDGYEKPYTTMVVNAQVKDDHVYLTTKEESNYENAIPYQNVACGHACEILEEDSLSDKTNAHYEHESLNLNNDMNDLHKTNDCLLQPIINPHTIKAEYINLSLNQ